MVEPPAEPSGAGALEFAFGFMIKQRYEVIINDLVATGLGNHGAFLLVLFIDGRHGQIG